jgi:xanthine dehydrogenase YagS FAD-binding subunit
VSARGEYRAGGTDVQQRLRSGVSCGPVVDIPREPGTSGIAWDGAGAARIGALTSIASVARDTALGRAYPGLSAAAGALATPQIRAAATIGGNLLQRNRCWYFRQPAIHCLKKGGDACPARLGNHLYGACFDLGPCIAVHPSTLGMALLAYEADIEVAGRGARSITALFGDGADPRHDHRLAERELLTTVVMPPPLRQERAAYFRAISRAAAEWPLVEALVRLEISDGVIRFARVGVGGVAPVPLRRERLEAALVGRPAGIEALDAAAALAADGAAALPMTGYKVALLAGVVRQALELALSRRPPDAG